MAKQRTNWLIFSIYSIVAGSVLWYHEMWRDELQAWGIASSATTLSELIYNARYEGHPMLWFVLLWPVASLWSNPMAMQVLHGCLALITAYLIVFRSPFTLVEKVLILFSYYFSYEYVAISRNYQIGVLLICLICVAWKAPVKNLLWISILLFFLFQTNVFAGVIGIGLSLGLLLEAYEANGLWPLSTRQVLAALLILTGLFLTSLSMPPSDYAFLTTWTNDLNWPTLLFASAGIAHGFFPITDFTVYHFWNYSYFPFGIAVKLLAGFSLLVVAYVSRPTDRVALVVLCASVLFLFVFTYLKPRGNLRHYGHYTVVLVAAYWIQGNRRQTGQTNPLGIVTVGYFGGVLLLIQALAGVNAWYREIRYPFSMASSMAAYIEENYPKTSAVAGVYQDCLTPVRWYLQRPIYYLDIQAYAPYVVFNDVNWTDALNAQADSITYSRYLAFQKKHTSSLLIMAYHSLPAAGSPQEGRTDTLHTRDGNVLVTCVKKFDGSITGEDYYLFNATK